MTVSRRLHLTLWSLLGGLALACLAAAGLAGLAISLRPQQSTPAPATAVLQIIPMSSPTSLPPTPTLTPTIPAASQNLISLGASVQISGTGGAGLRLRATPGLQGTVRLLALEAEIFRVTDGPIEADGYTWWHLAAPYDEKAQGWAVVNYLIPVETP